MANLDANRVARLAVKLELLSEAQVQEGQAAAEGDTAEALLHALQRSGALTPWQCQKLLKGESDGYFLGGYKLLYLISSGSFGRVYRAEDPQSGTVVAIKVLRKRWSDNPKTRELFEREGKVGQTLVHENIVQILAVNRDVATGQHYMVMEFVEGGTLKDFLGVRKKLEPAEALKLIEGAAAGLAHAHSLGMTHRDIKPTNILISSQGVAKLVDFGLASIQTTQGQEGEGKMQRTVDYAGLEKATGVKAGDVRSDIFFLGCTLYEMLTGKPPLAESKDARERMRAQRFDKIPPMHPDDVRAPQSLFHLVDKMMALNPEHRYQTPKQLLEALRMVRTEVEGKAAAHAAAPPPARTVFVVEAHEKLREMLRDRFKALGYKVLLANDPARALDRYQQQPYSALVLDAGTTGEEGMEVFQQVMADAEMRGQPTAGILILSESQAKWSERLYPRAKLAVFVRPVTLKQLETKLLSLVPPPVASA